MGRKIIYYALLTTGIVVILTGFQNLYTFWGMVTLPGITGQFTGVVCILGGFVNIWAARRIKRQLHLHEGSV